MTKKQLRQREIQEEREHIQATIDHERHYEDKEKKK